MCINICIWLERGISRDVRYAFLCCLAFKTDFKKYVHVILLGKESWS